MTPDLQRLQQNLVRLFRIVDYLELELVDDPQWPAPSDTSYLNERHRADPDIMANVEAMAATNQRIAWFGHDQEGFLGLWRGEGEGALERAPVVRLDTEGQYEIIAATIGDFLAVSMSRGEFNSAREELIEVGFTVAASHGDIWKALEGAESPNDYRHVLYNQGRVRRGLDPI